MVDNKRWHAFKIAKDVSERLHLTPDLRERAAFLYDGMCKVASSDGFKITNHVSLMAASLFLASRERAFWAAVTIRELCRAFTDLGHGMKCWMIFRDAVQFKRDLGLTHVEHGPADYIERLTIDLGHDRAFNARFEQKVIIGNLKAYVHRLKTLSSAVLDSIPKNMRDARNPLSLAGAAIYGGDIILSRQVGQKRVLTLRILADATGIADHSIRGQYLAVIKPILSHRRF